MRLYILPLGGCDCDKGRVLTRGSGEGEGFQAPVIRLPDSGTVVIAGDAISMEENLTEDNWAGAWNCIKARASARRLAAIAEAEGGQIIFGHDPNFWETVKLSPEYYT